MKLHALRAFVVNNRTGILDFLSMQSTPW